MPTAEEENDFCVLGKIAFGFEKKDAIILWYFVIECLLVNGAKLRMSTIDHYQKYCDCTAHAHGFLWDVAMALAINTTSDICWVLPTSTI